jgi:hypothetical protein
MSKWSTTILIGGKRLDAQTYWEKINLRVERLESALRPKKKKLENQNVRKESK